MESDFGTLVIERYTNGEKSSVGIFCDDLAKSDIATKNGRKAEEKDTRLPLMPKTRVLSKSGTTTLFDRERLHSCIESVCTGKVVKENGLPPLSIDPTTVTDLVVSGLPDRMTSEELHTHIIEEAASMVTEDTEYGEVASRMHVRWMQETVPGFGEYLEIARRNMDPKTGRKSPLLSEQAYTFMKKNMTIIPVLLKLTSHLEYKYDYFALRTWQKSYLLRSHELKGAIIESVNYLFVRVAFSLYAHIEDVDSAVRTFFQLANQGYIHASPTLFRAGATKNQLSSCFVFTVADDLNNILTHVYKMGMCSKHTGGIGFSVAGIRPKGSLIRSINGESGGIIPLLKVYDSLCAYAHQGGKRKGAFCSYLEPWHPEIYEYLDLLVKHGAEELRARELHTALWVPDLFMQRVVDDSEWSLFDISQCPGLHETYGAEFETLYQKYEKEGRAVKTVKAKDLFVRILERQKQTGHPHMCYKDPANQKSNEQNLGVIHSSNLCTEVMTVSTPDDMVGVCVLGSINVKKFVDERAVKVVRDALERGEKPPGCNPLKAINYEALEMAVRSLVNNLTMITCQQYFPIVECSKYMHKTRTVGVGISGLAQLFLELRVPFHSDDAREINRLLSESIYYAALTQSHHLAKGFCGPYEGFEGSPASKGKLQFHLWGKTIDDIDSGRYDWTQLVEDIRTHGLANAQLVCYMPTATTGSLLGNTQSFQPLNSNMFVRRTMAGDFIKVNTFLVEDLKRLGLWCNEMKQAIVYCKGSVQSIKSIPAWLKDVYKTVWEIPTSWQQTLAVERGWFTCQSQSLTVFERNPSIDKLGAIHIGAWKKGLKTGMYYLRTQPDASATSFTVDQELAEQFCLLTLEEAKVVAANSLAKDRSSSGGSSSRSKEKARVLRCINPEGSASGECDACGI